MILGDKIATKKNTPTTIENIEINTKIALCV